MDGGAWKAAVHEVAEGLTRLSDFTFTFHFNALEKEMATHSSVLAWRIPGIGEPGGVYGVAQSRTRLKQLSSSSSSSIYMGFPDGSDGEESVCKGEDPGLIPESGRSPGEQNHSPLQYCCLENSMDRMNSLWATAHGITKSWMPLSD